MRFYGLYAGYQVPASRFEPVAMLLLQHGDGPGGVGENCFTPEFDFGVVWIRGFDAVQAP
jgi:hypothetical protein